jgi:DNA-binding response OmpR family regulator
MSSLTVADAGADAGRPGRGSILVVDDEPSVAEIASRYLDRAGYATHTASDGAAAMDAATVHRPDLIVLDVKLPRIDGLEVMRRLRAEDRTRPAVILLSGRDGELDRVIGLRSGADDYIVKPFSPAELVARVDAVLRRAQPARTPAEPLEFGEIRIEPSARRVFVRGEEVQLAQREFDVLLYLAQHPGEVYTRDELMRDVWRYSFYTDASTVTVHIRRLRAKIEADPANPRHLKTVWGVGYRFEP